MTKVHFSLLGLVIVQATAFMAVSQVNPRASSRFGHQNVLHPEFGGWHGHILFCLSYYCRT